MGVGRRAPTRPVDKRTADPIQEKSLRNPEQDLYTQLIILLQCPESRKRASLSACKERRIRPEQSGGATSAHTCMEEQANSLYKKVIKGDI